MVQIEEGKFYRTRGGCKVGPMERQWPSTDERIYVGPGVNVMGALGGRILHCPQKYRCDGTVYMLRVGEEWDQIVAEWVDEPQLKTGDVVRLKSGGQDMTIREVVGGLVYVNWIYCGTLSSANFTPEMLEAL